MIIETSAGSYNFPVSNYNGILTSDLQSVPIWSGLITGEQFNYPVQYSTIPFPSITFGIFEIRFSFSSYRYHNSFFVNGSRWTNVDTDTINQRQGVIPVIVKDNNGNYGICPYLTMYSGSRYTIVTAPSSGRLGVGVWLNNTDGTAFCCYSTAISNGIKALLLPSIAQYTLSLDKYVWEYTGNQITPETTIINPDDNTKLVKNVDYTAQYANNINVGLATVICTGIGEYTGTKSVNFNIINSDDPYNPGGDSEAGGGSGNFDNTTDIISIPSLPTLSSLGSKFITLWTPTLAQLQAFATWLWTNTGLVDQIIKVYSNPIDHIIGLQIVPLDITYGNYVVNIGNISSGITMRRALTQYIPLDCGTVDISEYWGAYLDYAPYTKIQLYLPYIGFIQLDTDSVMGKTLGVKYICDILSGSCVAYVTVSSNGEDSAIAYTYTGNVASQIPVTNNDYSRIVSGTFTGVGTGIGLGLKAATATSMLGPASIGIGIAAGAAGAIGAGVIAAKQQVGRSGSISSTAGYLGYKKPYVVINRPRQAMPENQNKFTGYPGFITVQLQAVTGFTIVEEIHLDNTPATAEELSELLTILKTGFII